MKKKTISTVLFALATFCFVLLSAAQFFQAGVVASMFSGAFAFISGGLLINSSKDE